MSKYVIVTDSGCDIEPALLQEWGVRYVNLMFRFDHLDQDFRNDEMSVKEFYRQMREGHVAKTNAVNAETFREKFSATLAEGYDILYLGFSSGLSTTYKQSEVAAEDLAAEFPDRKIVTVDTLCASAGQGLLVKLAVEKRDTGATLEEVAAYVREVLPHLAHWFTVEDLVYLKRGGRVSPTVALVGSMLSIKPIMHVDDEGHLIKTGTVRGRKTSLKALADKVFETAEDPANGKIFISHGDCLEDAESLRDAMVERGAHNVELITNIGAVIGAHSGPGTMAVFFLAKQR